MPTAPVNGIQLYYEVHGDGPSTIVFAHGAAGNHLSWWQQIPFFSKRYRCITFSHRRFHLSPDVPDGPGASAFVDDLTALLDHLGIQETILVAQSMGGLTCFGFTLAHPHRVKALVMADTILGIPSAHIREMREELRKSKPDPGPDVPRYVSASFPQREPALTFLYEEIRSLNQGAGIGDLAGTMPPPPPDIDLSTIEVPILFLFGSEDIAIRPELGLLAHSLTPSSRYVDVEGAGHSVYFECAQEFNRIVSAFLTECGM